jgi:hypothetical protein
LVVSGRIVLIQRGEVSLDDGTSWYVRAPDVTVISWWFRGDPVTVFEDETGHGYTLRNSRNGAQVAANCNPRFQRTPSVRPSE